MQHVYKNTLYSSNPTCSESLHTQNYVIPSVQFCNDLSHARPLLPQTRMADINLVLTLVPCSPGLTDSKQLREAEQGHYQQLKILPQVSTNLKGITWGSPPLAFLPVLHQYIVVLDSSVHSGTRFIST